jgi:hypothetical protein
MKKSFIILAVIFSLASGLLLLGYKKECSDIQRDCGDYCYCRYHVCISRILAFLSTRRSSFKREFVIETVLFFDTTAGEQTTTFLHV